MATEKFLLKLGCDVIGKVTKGEDAVDTVEQSRPDIIFMDIGLAGEMDGIETCREIRKKFDGIRIVFISGNDDEISKKRAKEAGGEDYFVKPVVMKDLKKIVSKKLYY